MKKLFIIPMLLFSMIAFTSNYPVKDIDISTEATSSFCKGWKDGYKAGYCYRVNGCISPIVPICPIAKIGETTYQDGYNRGFVAGRAAQ